MKIILSTGSLYQLPYNEIFRIAAKYSFDGIELYLQNPRELFEINPIDIISLIGRYQLPVYTIHTPSYERYLFEFLFRRKVTTIKILRRVQELAYKIDAKILIIHPWPGIFSKGIIRKKMNRLIKNTLITNNELKIAFEVLPSILYYRFCPHCLNRVSEFYRFCRKENYYVVVDTSHLLSQRQNPIIFFNNLKNFVVDIHLSDYKNKLHHLPLGEGKINFDEFFKTLSEAKYEHFLTLELLRKRFYREDTISKCKEIIDRLVKKYKIECSNNA